MVTQSATERLIDLLVARTYPTMVVKASRTPDTPFLAELARGAGGLPEGVALTPDNVEGLCGARLRGLAEIFLRTLPLGADGRCVVSQAMLIAFCFGMTKDKLARRAHFDSVYVSIAIAQMAEVLLNELQSQREGVRIDVGEPLLLVADPD